MNIIMQMAGGGVPLALAPGAGGEVQAWHHCYQDCPPCLSKQQKNLFVTEKYNQDPDPHRSTLAYLPGFGSALQPVQIPKSKN
jgi:hypothetical protein